MKYLIITLLFTLPALAAYADCEHNWMQCPVSSSLQVNSFTIQAASTINAITIARLAATQALVKHKITVSEAKIVLAETDLGRQLWNSARAVCNADAHGNCESQAASYLAFALLDLARGTLK